MPWNFPKKVEKIQKSIEKGENTKVYGLMRGIGKGIAGIVQKPVTGVLNLSTTLEIKGIGKGIAGIVQKPVTGVLNLSTTLETINNRMDYLKIKCDKEEKTTRQGATSTC